MPKRRFEEYVGTEGKPNSASNGALRLQRERIEAILEQAKKTLARALKVARGFERQKLGRRQKVAKEQKEDAETARLAAEVTALKTFNLSILAELQIYNTLLKTKRIASAPAFPASITAKVQASLHPQDVAHANVQARLFNSNPVKTAINEIIDRVRVVLGIEETQPLRKRRTRAADYRSDQSDGQKASIKKHVSTSIQVEDDQNGSDWHGFSDAKSLQEDQESKNGDDNVDFGMYESRIAASSDEESQIEGSPEDGLQREEAVKHKESGNFSPNSPNHGKYSPNRDLSLSPTQDNTSSSALPLPLTQKVPKKSSKPRATTFLPSLAIGGYWSGSESAISDLDKDESQPRRNRRGQQERRAIWEKKYGRNANHLKTQSKSRNRDEGWDARRGARSNDDTRGKRGRGRGRGTMSGRFGTVSKGNLGATGANSDPVVAKNAKAVGSPLHPSWEAAKKRKDENKSVAFAGKKVVFD